MSELQDLLGLYAAIDHAVVDDPGLAEVVAPYIGAYTSPEAVGWADQLEAAFGPGTSSVVTDALQNLAATPARGRPAARRLLALAVLARVRPDLLETGPGVTHSIHDALAVDGLAGDLTNAPALVELLLDDTLFTSLAAWDDLLAAALDDGRIPAHLALQADAPPCSGHAVPVPGGADPYPAAQFTTSFTTDQITMQQAMRFLEPSNWPGCSDFWCDMTQVGEAPHGVRTYREVVSVGCGDPAAWTAETYLDFVTTTLGHVALVSYDLSPSHRSPDGQIVVDNGWLIVEQVQAGIRVRSRKVVKFAHPFAAPTLAAIMCPLGYASAGEDLLFGCALGHGDDPDAGTPFPDHGLAERPDPAAREARRPSGAAHTAASTGRQPDRIGPVLDEVAALVTTCVDDLAARWTASATRLAEGTYSGGDLVRDAAELWSRAVRDVAVAADLLASGVASTPPGGGAATPSAPAAVSSSPFETHAAPAGTRTVRLAGPLASNPPGERIPTTAVTVVPHTLPAGATTFHLEVDATGHTSLIYSGAVEVRDANGGLVETVAVWVAV